MAQPPVQQRHQRRAHGPAHALEEGDATAILPGPRIGKVSHKSQNFFCWLIQYLSNLLSGDFHANNLRRLKQTVDGEAHNAGHDEEPCVRGRAQYRPQAAHRAEDDANVVDHAATKAAANEKCRNSITNYQLRPGP